MAIIEETFSGDAAIDALIRMVQQWRSTKRVKRVILSINGNDVQLFVRAHEKAFDADQAAETPGEETQELPALIELDSPLEQLDINGNPLP